MNITTKTLTYDKPIIHDFETNWQYANRLSKLKTRIFEDIRGEFNDFYSNKERINKYNWGKVGRTSFLNLNPVCLIKDSQIVFEIFEMDGIIKNSISTHYQKGKVLEKMVLNIVFK